MDALELRERVRLVLGYDHDDPIWSEPDSRRRVGRNATWLPMIGLTGRITAIWNRLASWAHDAEFILPANDDLAFQSSPMPAVESLRRRGGFGTVSFADEAFPGLPTFYVASCLHFDIFNTLYPLPWQGAHQDPWIADVYRPWGASDIDERVRVHNRIGGITAPRFDYGDAPGYADEVMAGRRKANRWLAAHQGGLRPEPLTDEELQECPMLM